MDNAALWLAIAARAQADTGSGGLFNSGTPLVQGIYPNVAPNALDLNFPFIVFDVADVSERHAFAKDIYSFTVRFSVYVPYESQSIGAPQKRASDIINRLVGDWASASPSTAPSYGFHRHKLVIASGSYSATHMLKTGSMVNHTDESMQFIEEYSLTVFR